MKKLLLLLAMLATVSCKEKTVVLPVQRTLNGTTWKKFEYRQSDRDVHKIISFRAPDVVNISVRDDHGYLIGKLQEEYIYIYEHPRFRVFGPFDVPFAGRIIDDTQMEFQGEAFVKSK